MLKQFRNLGAGLSSITERWVPDAWVFCMMLTAIAIVLCIFGAGATVEENDDGLTIHGSGGVALAGGGPVATHLDHRIAMSMAVAGLASRDGVAVDSIDPIATSFPNFTALLDTATR